MTEADIRRLLALGLSADEIWCAIHEPGPWFLSTHPQRATAPRATEAAA